MLKIGLLGFGFMGLTHYQAYQQLDDAEVAGVFDMKPEDVRAGKLASGNIGDGESSVDLSGLTITGDVDELINSSAIDIIDVCLPTYVHADFAVRALEAGKHVFCEKPMAMNPAECDRMLAARDAAGTNLMIGQCIRFWPEYAYVREAIRKRTYGNVVSAFFRRLSPTPTWSYENWILDQDKSGGALLDLHIHDIDYILNVFGDVSEVSSSGVQNASAANSGVDYVLTEYQTDSPAVIFAEGGWHFQPEFPFNMSFHIRCERASFVFDAGQEKTLAICTEDGGVEYPSLSGTTGWDEELKYFVDCVKNNKSVEASPPEESKKAVEIALMECDSVKKQGR